MNRLFLAAVLATFSLPALAQGLNRIDAYGNFIPNFGGTQTMAVTAASSSVTLTAIDAQNTDLNLYNSGASLVFCRWGNGAQTATLADMPIPVGSSRTFSKFILSASGVAAATTQVVACIAVAAGTATVYVTTGVGR